MDKETSRNTIIFFISALALLVVYNFFFLQPEQKRLAAEKAKMAAAAPASGTASDAPSPSYIPTAQALDRPHIVIDTPSLKGSIALEGARFDDLALKGYQEKIDPKSPMIELLRPSAAQFGYFAQFGWTGQNLAGLPDAKTVWTVADSATLSPGHPVRLSYASPAGLTFTRDIAVDDKFMFTVTDTVANTGTAPVTLTPYATVERQGLPPPAPRARPSNDGVFSALGGDKPLFKLKTYRAWAKDGQYAAASKGGWMGLGDKYWLTALIPDQKEQIQTHFTTRPLGADHIFELRYDGQPHNLPPGAQATETRRLFAGAKREPLLAAYGKDLAIPRFVDAIDWGWGWFITKPLFWLIKFFEGWTNNFGLAILVLTVLIKAVFFYPMFLSIEMGAKMKKVAPQAEKLKERFKDDPVVYQQQVMALYKTEKVNPMLGCIPMLVTIPVFFALFKVLNTTIEMRQAPFFGWIHDLSDRDPTTFMNLFGLIPWDPATAPLIGGFLDGPLHLGIWPLLYGLTMYLTQSMSPPAADPTQQAIMKWLPVVFTFVMGNFAAGLIIYYCWSNALTIVQQYISYHRLKLDNPIDRLIGRLTGKPKPAG